MKMAEAATDPLWWVGWRPVETVSVGAAAGLLAGYFRGALGLGVAALGLLVVGGGVFSPLVRKTCFVAAVGAFVTFLVFGAEAVVSTFESVGLGDNLQRAAEAVSVRVLDAAAFVGFETGGTPTGVVGEAAAGLALWSLAGAAVGCVVWALCAYTVNRRHTRVREALVDRVREAGKDVLGEDGTLHTLTHGEGSVFLVESAKRYNVTNVLVGETSVCLHHGSTVDMAYREVRTSDSTKEIYYDQMVSVDHEEPRVRLGKADGEVVRIVTSEKPVELLEEIEERIREYKKKERSAQEKEAKDERASLDGAGSKGSDDRAESEPGNSIEEEVEEALDAFGEALGKNEDEDEDEDEGEGEGSMTGRSDGSGDRNEDSDAGADETQREEKKEDEKEREN